MNLATYGIYPYRLNDHVRYFIEGVHGNFHLGNTNFINDDVYNFLKGKGGLMKVINHQDKGLNSEKVFSIYGSKEALCGKQYDSYEHPYEKWGVDYYHPHFDILETTNATFILYFRKKEIFLFLDDKITFNQNEWVSRESLDEMTRLLDKHMSSITAVFSFHCVAGNVFHQVTEGILRNKMNSLGQDGP